MNRVLKFREWDDRLKQFIYIDFFNVRHYVAPKDRYKIQQFTGLLDKNKKEIYEGDIVKYNGLNLDFPFIGTVEFWNCCFTCYEKSSEVRITLGAGLALEVIGNIFEQPEQKATVVT